MEPTSQYSVSGEESLNAALQHLQAGQLPEAERLYRQVLANHPNHPDALHYLGVIALQCGRNDLAVELIQKAISLDPSHAEVVYNNLGRALHACGRLQEAAQRYERAIELRPGLADLHFNLGNVYIDLGRPEQARRCYEHALALRPDFPGADNNLGNVLLSLGRPEDARQHFMHVIALHPDSADAYHNFGNFLKLSGSLEEAAQNYRRALELRPDSANTHRDLAYALQHLGRPEEAKESYQRALALDPNNAEAYNNLGVALFALGCLEQSAQAYQHALILEPDYAEAHSNLGNALQNLGQLEEAEHAFHQALTLKPDFAVAHSNLALLLNYIPERTSAEIYAQHLQFGHRFRTEDRRALTNVPDSSRPLRIGYVSADFRHHPVAFFLEPVLANHSRTDHEVICYQTSSHSDATTSRLKGHADHWFEVSALTDDALANLIRENAVDILVDLGGHTSGNRLLTFARKPSPVQVTWLGYLNTTGMEAMNWRITDERACPKGMFDLFHTERLLRLPDSQWCYQPPVECPDVTAPPSLKAGYVTFGVFSTSAKINSRMLELWRRILERVPASRLLIVASGLASVSDRFRARFTELGIPGERLQLLGARAFGDYLSLHGAIDVVLDTVPYTGGTTTCHALWMGVPVVSLMGDTSTSRGGASILHAVNLPEMVAATPDRYVEIASELARDSRRLIELRSGLRDRMRSSPLTDGRRFTRHLEDAYRTMWRNWCETSQT